MIRISELPLIHTPQQFFDTDKILLIDVISLGPANKKIAKDIGNQAFTYHGQLYLPIPLMGSPESFFLNCRNGVPFCFSNGTRGIYKWDADLTGAINELKLYDFSEHYTPYKAGKVQMPLETGFIISRYLAGRQEVGL